MANHVFPADRAKFRKTAGRGAPEARYLANALSPIMPRAWRAARDGLKPVHRRILYGMRLLRLDPGTTLKKSAKIVGDVVGNFHPHGDPAIYDALVRAGQGFSPRLSPGCRAGHFRNIGRGKPPP